MGSRINDLAVVHGVGGAGRRQPRIYVATPGGIFRSDNEGESWTPLFDDASTLSVNAIAIAPSNGEVVWAGTGENFPSGPTLQSSGVYRSANGGKTWHRAGLESGGAVFRIRIHPSHPSTVYVAMAGTPWVASTKRGLYKTTDGGRTWRRILFVNDWTGAVDVVLDPFDPEIVYAAMQQRGQTARVIAETGPGSGLYVSRDGGRHWVKVSGGWKLTGLKRIGVTLSPVIRGRVYALATFVESDSTLGIGQHEVAKVLVSGDYGGHWTAGGVTPSGSGSFTGSVLADPRRYDRVYALMSKLRMSDDAGGTWSRALCYPRFFVVDVHALWIDPDRPQHLLIGSDQGLWTTFDGGATCRRTADLPGGMFYSVAVDDRRPFYDVYGVLQDFSAVGVPSQTRDSAGIGNNVWFSTGFGEGGQIATPPADSYAVYWSGDHVERFDRTTRERRFMGPRDEYPSAYVGKDSPLLISRGNKQTIYAGSAGGEVWRTIDGGFHWAAISPVLDSAPTDSVWFAGARRQPVPGSNITSLAQSPRSPSTLFVGTGSGRLYVSRDDGTSWTMIAPPSMSLTGERVYVTAAYGAAGEAFVIYNGSQNGDYRPHVFKVDDCGRQWSDLTDGLPTNAAVWVVAQHFRDASLLFAGTDDGVFVSSAGGKGWRRLGDGMPVIRVRTLALQHAANSLVAGTYGRGIFVLDDLTGLERSAERDTARRSQILPVPGARRFRWDDVDDRSYPAYVAPNPPYGARITYVVGIQDSGKVIEAEIRDSIGNVAVRGRVPSSAGLHSVVWNLTVRYDRSARDSTPILAVPGHYRVSLQVTGGVTKEPMGDEPFVVEPDPLITLNEAGYDSLYRFMRREGMMQARADSLAGVLRRRIGLTAAATRGLASRRACGQPSQVNARLAQLCAAARELGAEQEPWDEVAFGKPINITGLVGDQLSAVGGATAAPTPRQWEIVSAVEGRLDAIQHQLQDR